MFKLNRDGTGIKFLVEKKLAACVQISAIDSVYSWKGKIEKAKEYRLVIKGRSFSAIEKALKKIHPYEVPEIISVPVKSNKSYLNWINKNSN